VMTYIPRWFGSSAGLPKEGVGGFVPIPLTHLNCSTLDDVRMGRRWSQQVLLQNLHSLSRVFLERDKSKASTTPCLFVAHDGDIDHLSKLLEVLFNVQLFC